MVRTYPTIFGTRVTMRGAIIGPLALCCGVLSIYWVQNQLLLVLAALLLAVVAVTDSIVTTARHTPDPEEANEIGRAHPIGDYLSKHQAGDGWIRSAMNYRYTGRTGKQFSLIGIVLFLIAMPILTLIAMLWPVNRNLFLMFALGCFLGAYLDSYLMTRMYRSRASDQNDSSVD